jgi:hypothetical protein
VILYKTSADASRIYRERAAAPMAVVNTATVSDSVASATKNCTSISDRPLLLLPVEVMPSPSPATELTISD